MQNSQFSEKVRSKGEEVERGRITQNVSSWFHVKKWVTNTEISKFQSSKCSWRGVKAKNGVLKFLHFFIFPHQIVLERSNLYVVSSKPEYSPSNIIMNTTRTTNAKPNFKLLLVINNWTEFLKKNYYFNDYTSFRIDFLSALLYILY